MTDELSAGDAADGFLDNRLRLRQSRTGHRVGTDAILLAAASGAGPGDTVVDVGAGVGAVGLAIAARVPRCRVTLVESDLATSALAERNVADNALGDRVRVCALDIFDRHACKGSGHLASGSIVVTNPPFFVAGDVRASTDAKRAKAHVLAEGGIGHADWQARAFAFLGPHGRLLTIHRVDVLPALLGWSEGRLGGILIRPVHPRALQPATRVLFGGRMGSRAPMSLLPPLVVHEDDGRFTGEADALHRGAAMAFWP